MPSTPTAPTTAPPAASRLQAQLRRASNPAGVARLLRSLGLGGDFPALGRGTLLRAGLRASVTRQVRCGGTVVPAYVAETAAEAGPAVVEQLAAALGRLAGGPCLLVVAPPRARTLVFGCRAPDGALRFAPVDRLRPRAAELHLLAELAAAPAGEVARLLHWARVLERGSVGVRFFRDIRAHRDALARAWTGLPAGAKPEREQLALLLLCRLLFLCFLQERGHLLGDRDYLARLVREGRHGAGGCLYDVVLRPLFFGAFNTRPEQRSAAALALGALPYLNGGLFEPHALERRYAALSLPDEVLLRTFTDLLGRYRFGTEDAAAAAARGALRAGIDPEVLGRVFEALMAAPRRGETGSFYTPPAVVDGIVVRALAHALAHGGTLAPEHIERLLLAGDVAAVGPAHDTLAARLASLRVLDPACGSGAFLLGALSRITLARCALEPGRCANEVRRQVVGETLHGVDLLDDAALLCALRLWLALAPGAGEPVTPLPNLDRRIRQGDALLDPLDLLTPGTAAGTHRGAALAPEVRRVLRELDTLGRAYLHAEPAARAALRAQLRAAEGTLARSWLQALRERVERGLREARAAAEGRDLWGEPASASSAGHRTVDRLAGRVAELDCLLRQLADASALPFFSFAVHFAAERGGFDVVLGNPPWVRAHRWPATLAGTVRERFRVCCDAGWPGVRALGNGSGPGTQVDLALLFLERGLDLLAPGGVLGMLLPAKLLRSLFAGGARALLLERTALLELDDHSLDQHSVFQADAFTVQLLARLQPVAPAGDQAPAAAAPASLPAQVQVTLRNRGREPLRFELPAAALPLIPGDTHAPWLLAPPDVLATLRALQQSGVPLGRVPGLALRRGIITGANDVLVIPAAEHKLGGLSHIRAQGWFRARRSGDGSAAAPFAGWIETACLRPLLRGADVKAWRWSAPQRLLWTPANERPGAPTPERTARYLARHARALAHRGGNGRNGAAGRMLRAGSWLGADKVVWQDIADDLHAAAVPAAVRGDDGAPVPVIPLNTVYFIAAPSPRAALVLAALLNSLPLRVFARAAAERAKDACFRFFAWTVAALPVPARWLAAPLADELAAISAAAHRDGGIAAGDQQRLDALVADALALTASQCDALRAFDTWLKR